MRRIYESLISFTERKFKVDARYFLSGGFWLTAAQGATAIMSLVSTVFLTHFLTETQFGIYRYIIGLAIFFSALSLTGIGQAIFQASAKKLAGFYGTATRQTILYSAPMVIASLAGSAYYYINDNNVLAIGALLIALLFPWSFLFQNIQAHIFGQQNFKRSTLMQTAKAFFVAGSTIVTLFFTTNILWLLLSYFLSQAIAGLFAHLWYRPKTETIDDQALSNKLMSFAKHTTLRNVIVGISSRLDTIIVFQLLGASSLAVFTIATLIPDQIKGSLKNVVVLLIPKFAKNDSLEETRKYLPKRSLQLGLLLVAVTVVVIILTPYVINTFFPKYTEAIIYAQLLALSFPASIYQIPFAIMQAHTKEKALYSYHIYTAIAQIVFTVIGISLFGLLGAIAARIISQYTQLITALLTVYRHDSKK
jgi:O-antigen/teichoic acid export membrane protein